MEAQEGNSSDIRWPETEVGSANASNTSNVIEDFNDVPSNQGDFDHSAIDPSVRPSKKVRSKVWDHLIKICAENLKDQRAKCKYCGAILGADPAKVDSEHVLKRARPFGISDEACAFRDSYEKFKKARAEVVGISSDDVSSHKVAKYRRCLLLECMDPHQPVKRLAFTFIGLCPIYIYHVQTSHFKQTLLKCLVGPRILSNTAEPLSTCHVRFSHPGYCFSFHCSVLPSLTLSNV
ncbi:hypothetical protein Ancab_005792 [Ancistrocladus abbreviatus]